MPFSRFVASLAEDRWEVRVFDQARLSGRLADHIESGVKPIEPLPASLFAFAFSRQANPRIASSPNNPAETTDSPERSERCSLAASFPV